MLALQERVTVCGELPKETLAGRVQVKPEGVEADAERFTMPVSPLTAVIVIVEFPDEPAGISAGDTVPADIVKSAKWNVMAAVVRD